VVDLIFLNRCLISVQTKERAAVVKQVVIKIAAARFLFMLFHSVKSFRVAQVNIGRFEK
jgi:hypothetical protein